MSATTQLSPLVSCIHLLVQASSELGTPIPSLDAERIGFFVAEVMSTRNREFHDLEHAVNIASSSHPIAQLAGVFHDIVYAQIDGVETPALKTLLAPCEVHESLSLYLTPALLSNGDVSLCATLFGFGVGATLTIYSGLNEFLSALGTYRLLKPFLNPEDLLGVITGIEATIPFRFKKIPQLDENCILRLKAAAKQLSLSLTEETLQNLFRAAVEVANRDVMGFATQSPVIFVQDTWALLYETNPDLQKRFYLLPSYLHAVNRMDQFFQQLEPTSILRQFNGYPEETVYRELLKRCEFNVMTGRQYTAIKLVEVALLNAIAECSGGTVPADFFYGARSNTRNTLYSKLEDFLPIPKSIPGEAGQKIVHEETYRLLTTRGEEQTRFDNKTSYLAAYLISQFKNEGELTALYYSAKEYVLGTSHAYEYLSRFNPDTFSSVAEAITQIAPTRRELISKLVERVLKYGAEANSITATHIPCASAKGSRS